MANKIDLTCDCGSELSLEAQYAGKKIRCPSCSSVLVVPKPIPKRQKSVTKNSGPRQTKPQKQASQNVVSPTEPRELADPRTSQASKMKATWTISGAALVVLTVGVLSLVLSGGPDEQVALKDDNSHRKELPNETSNGGDVDAPTQDSSGPGEKTEENGSKKSSPSASHRTESQPRENKSQLRQSQFTPPVSKRNSARTGFSGRSSKYTDIDCQMIQSKYGVYLPLSANHIEVNGEVVHIEGIPSAAVARAPVLMLPQGEHSVRFRSNEGLVPATIQKQFSIVYADMRKFFGIASTPEHAALLERAAVAMDVQSTPFLINFAGAVHAQQEKWEVAERKFCRAIRINPLFVPAHLNLAHCLKLRGDIEGAKHEVLLAHRLNVCNAYGLNAPIHDLLVEYDILEFEEEIVLEMDHYDRAETYSNEDTRMVALMTGISKYAVHFDDEAKILNNLATHFADRKKPHLALQYYRKSLEAVLSVVEHRNELAKDVFSNMMQTCKDSNLTEEADEFQQIIALLGK